MSWITTARDGSFLDIKVNPRSSRPGIGGVVGDRLVIRVAAAPADGKANEELIEFLAKTFDVSKSSIEISSGQASRQKRILIRGLVPEVIRRKITHG